MLCIPLVILSLLLRELKKGETFASFLNIHGGDIRVVPTHLVCNLQSRTQPHAVLVIGLYEVLGNPPT